MFSLVDGQGSEQSRVPHSPLIWGHHHPEKDELAGVDREWRGVP